MNPKALALMVALALTMPAADAQMRGGGGMQGGQKQGSSMGQMGQMGQQGQQGQQQPGMQGQGQGDMDRDRDRDRIRATDQQRDQYRACTQAQDRVQMQAREMQQAARGGGLNAEQAQRLRDQLRERYQEMEQAHMRLMHDMSPEQKEALRDHIRKMDRERTRMHEALQDLDAELKESQMQRARVQQHARDVEKATERWRKQHRELGEELGMGKES
jgi:DNA-directed RNA polymerase subunit F